MFTGVRDITTGPKDECNDQGQKKLERQYDMKKKGRIFFVVNDSNVK